jgi:hypothetical protein
VQLVGISVMEQRYQEAAPSMGFALALTAIVLSHSCGTLVIDQKRVPRQPGRAASDRGWAIDVDLYEAIYRHGLES